MQGRWQDPLLELVLVVLAALVAVTCATTGELVRVGPGVPSVARGGDGARPFGVEAAGPPTSPAAPVALASGAGPAPPEGAAEAATATTWRSTFEALANRARGESIRVVWLGDSHTAADFLTHAVREELQSRYGNGGPGFLRLGVSPYRHGRAKVVVQGKWRRVPGAPARVTVTDDGVFGVGGQRAEPASADARVTVELYSSAVPGEARWDVAFRFPAAPATFEVVVDDGPPLVVDARDGPLGELRHLEVVGRAGGELGLARFSGRVELFGVVVEGNEPGVVLDTIGIDGARIATLLAWDEATFVAELARRRPDLVVLAFGTNEVFAVEDVERYPPQYARVLARVRTAWPVAQCLLVGPTDVPGRDAPDGRLPAIERAQARAAEAEGCGYLSLARMMGGEGAFVRWANASPALAAPDGVHLLHAGYERLGQELVDILVGPR